MNSLVSFIIKFVTVIFFVEAQFSWCLHKLQSSCYGSCKASESLVCLWFLMQQWFVSRSLKHFVAFLFLYEERMKYGIVVGPVIRKSIVVGSFSKPHSQACSKNLFSVNVWHIESYIPFLCMSKVLWSSQVWSMYVSRLTTTMPQS